MFSKKVVDNLSKSSFIRAMFEEGTRLRSLYGDENVYDFSLGNPDSEPPDRVCESYKFFVNENTPGKHKYMSNAGYDEVRRAIASSVSKDADINISCNNIVMTIGAAGGLNVVLKSLLNTNDEVIVFAPYFPEYLFYIDNHGGIPVIVKPDINTLQPDLDELKKSITNRTKAIIINSPNNPTGVVYSEILLKRMSSIIEEKSCEYDSKIFVISDEPYTKIVYDNVKVPSILKLFNNSISVNSFSKSLSLPGERIGYIAANPEIEDIDTLMSALIFCNRTLGFVNAPSLVQKVVASSIDSVVDTSYYKQRRDVLLNNMTSIGIECIKPEGAFYLFPRSPIMDDVAFCKKAVDFNILIVPGTGFGQPGFFRMAYCVSLKTINDSLPAFIDLMKVIRIK